MIDDAVTGSPGLVAICTPVYDTYEPHYWRSFHTTVMPGPVIHCEAHGQLYADALNEVTEKALAADATHLMFIDADMAWPRDAIVRLLARNLPIVGGLCFSRRPPYGPTMWDGDKRIEEWQDGDLVKVTHTGGAFLLVKREVFEKVGRSKPWRDDGTGRCPDVCFLDRARAAGFDVHVDTACKITHFGKVAIDEAFWRRNR